MANMYQFSAGGGAHSYTYPPAAAPARPQPYGGHQQYPQNQQPGSYPPQQQYQSQPTYYGPPQGYQPSASQPPQATTYSQPPSYQYQQSGVPSVSPTQAPYPQTASPSQYGPTPHHPLQQPRKHSAPQPETQACYNCGGRDHFAQNCPEPRRAVPAGSLVPRPPKRQKTGGPIVTRYAPPPGYQPPQPQQPQRGYTFPQPGHHEPLSMPSTFTSQNQPWGHWQGSHQPVYQPPNMPPQPPISGPWNPQNPSGLGSHDVQSPSPMSATGSNPWQSHMPTPSPSQQVSGPGSAFALQSNHSSAIHSNAPTPGIPPVPPMTQQPPAIPNEEEDLIDTIKAAGPKMEPWLEELKELDDAFDKQRRGGGPTVSHPPNPVGQPLASTMALADAIGRLPIAASLAPGVPVSIFFREMTDKDLETNVRDSTTWSVVKDDTLFAEISRDCEVVKLEDLIELREEMTGALIDEDDESEAMQADEQESRSGRSDSETRATDRYSDYSDRSSHERPGSREDIEEEHDMKDDNCLTPPRAVTSEEYDNPDKRSVHGNEPASRERLVDHRRSSHGRINQRSDPYERPSNRDTRFRDQRSGRDSRQSTRRRFSRERQHSRQRQRSPRRKYPQDRDDRRHRSWDRQKPPPPPPPPPPPRHRYYDGPNDQTPPKKVANGEDAVSNDADLLVNNKEDVIGDAADLSPAWGNDESEAEKDATNRVYRAPSEESNGGPKRQEDLGSASRKRQPHVASAYGRRW